MPAYLITYKRRSGHIDFRKFESLQDATRERLRLDRLNNDPDLEIVAVASDSEANFRQSHSRYFSAL